MSRMCMELLVQELLKTKKIISILVSCSAIPSRLRWVSLNLVSSSLIKLLTLLSGIGLASWGNIFTCFQAMNGWTNDQATSWSTTITSITIGGAMIGALFSGNFTKYGKKRMIQIINLILLCSVGICMVNNIYVISVGRFFWGICAGSFTVMCPKFLNEYLPIELKGSFGAIN